MRMETNGTKQHSNALQNSRRRLKSTLQPDLQQNSTSKIDAVASDCNPKLS